MFNCENSLFVNDNDDESIGKNDRNEDAVDSVSNLKTDDLIGEKSDEDDEDKDGGDAKSSSTIRLEDSEVKNIGDGDEEDDTIDDSRDDDDEICSRKLTNEINGNRCHKNIETKSRIDVG